METVPELTNFGAFLPKTNKQQQTQHVENYEYYVNPKNHGKNSFQKYNKEIKFAVFARNVCLKNS